MGCQTTYSCPIVIPAGAAGATGAAGTNGTDGVAVLANTLGTDFPSSSTGSQTLTHYDLGAGVPKAGDIIVVEALFYLSSTFVGSIYLTYGNTTDKISNYTVVSGGVSPLNLSSVFPVKLTGKIRFTSATVQAVEKESILYGTPASMEWDGLVAFSVNSAVASVINVCSNPSAGVATCKYFNVIHYKKV
jgi:hypothetical protein